MTLCIAYTSPQLCVIVADRRLTSTTGTTITDSQNKAVSLNGYLVGAYAGDAWLNDTKHPTDPVLRGTDIWLCDQMVKVPDGEDWIETLREALDTRFATLPDGAHAFMFTGAIPKDSKLPLLTNEDHPQDLTLATVLVSNCDVQQNGLAGKRFLSFRTTIKNLTVKHPRQLTALGSKIDRRMVPPVLKARSAEELFRRLREVFDSATDDSVGPDAMMTVFPAVTAGGNKFQSSVAGYEIPKDAATTWELLPDGTRGHGEMPPMAVSDNGGSFMAHGMKSHFGDVPPDWWK